MQQLLESKDEVWEHSNQISRDIQREQHALQFLKLRRKRCEEIAVENDVPHRRHAAQDLRDLLHLVVAHIKLCKRTLPPPPAASVSVHLHQESKYFCPSEANEYHLADLCRQFVEFI